MSNIVAAYCDGGLIVAPGQKPGASPHGGTWAYVLVGAGDQVIGTGSGLLLASDLGDPVGNNTAEFQAAAMLLRALPDGWSGTIGCDSRVTIGRLHDGWERNGIPEGLSALADHHLRRLGALTWVLLDGHPTKAQLAAGIGKRGNPVSPHNVLCDKLCGEAGERWLRARR